MFAVLQCQVAHAFCLHRAVAAMVFTMQKNPYTIAAGEKLKRIERIRSIDRIEKVERIVDAYKDQVNLRLYLRGFS